MTTPQDNPKSRLQAHAPQCPRCNKPMKVRVLLPGRTFDDVLYRCEECRDEVVRAVPGAR
jgi:transposase-like protein